MMKQIRIPKINGRPLILFPEGWQHGWLADVSPDPNAAFSQKWSLRGWQEFRELHYLDIVPSPFGYLVSDDELPQMLTPYAPWGLNRDKLPKLHPTDI